MRKSIFKLLTLIIVTVACASLLACESASPSAGVPGDTTDGQVNAPTTVSVASVIEQADIEGRLNGENGVIRSALKRRIAEEFPSADGVEVYLADEQGAFLIVKEGDGSRLVTVSSQVPDEIGDIFSSPEERVLAIAGVDATAVVAETETDGIKQKIDRAIEDYEASVIGALDELEISKNEISEIYMTVSLDGSSQRLFDGATEIIVSAPTVAMPHTAEGELSTENCRMAYAFSLSNDGKVSAYVLTLPDVSNMFDNLATDAVIELIGSYASTSRIELPALAQPVKPLTFDELYAQVFGEDYVFTPFEEAFDKIMDDAFRNTTEYKNLCIEFSAEKLVVYSNCKIASSQSDRLGIATYRGEHLAELYEYAQLSEQVEEISLQDYAKQVSGFVENENNDEAEVKAKLEQLKSQIETLQKTADETGYNNFKLAGQIMNTETNINISDYAEHYIPADATPIACYVDVMHQRTLDNRFGTGYTQSFDMATIYKTNEGVFYRDFTVIVPWYTNSTTQSSYALGLGREGKDYIFGKDVTTLIEDPILTGVTVGVG